jgi:hypothetical protein
VENTYREKESVRHAVNADEKMLLTSNMRENRAWEYALDRRHSRKMLFSGDVLSVCV